MMPGRRDKCDVSQIYRRDPTAVVVVDVDVDVGVVVVFTVAAPVESTTDGLGSWASALTLLEVDSSRRALARLPQRFDWVSFTLLMLLRLLTAAPDSLTVSVQTR